MTVMFICLILIFYKFYYCILLRLRMITMSLQEAILNEHKRIGAKIMYYRKVNRFTQGQLSLRSSVPKTAISRMERGKGEFKLEQIMLIAKAVDIDYREILK